MSERERDKSSLDPRGLQEDTMREFAGERRIESDRRLILFRKLSRCVFEKFFEMTILMLFRADHS